MVLFSTGIGERSSGQSHVNSGSRHTSRGANTFMFSLSGSNTCRVCVPGATTGTVLLCVLLLYNCCIKWNKSLLDVVITPVLSHGSKCSFYVQYEKDSCVIVFFWHGATVLRLMWPLISPRETKNQEIKKKAVTDFLLTNIYNCDSLKMKVYKRLEKRLQVIHLLGDHFIDWRWCNVAKMQPGK